MRLPFGNDALNELTGGGLVVPGEPCNRNLAQRPYIVLVTGRAGLGKSVLSVSTAYRWSIEFGAQRTQVNQQPVVTVIYAAPHTSRTVFREFFNQVVEQYPEDVGTLYRAEPLREGAGADYWLTETIPASNDVNCVALFVDSLSPMRSESVEDIIKVLRFNRITADRRAEAWSKVAVVWLVYDGPEAILDEFEHVADTVIRFTLDEPTSYWSPSVEIAKTPQEKVHGKHQVKLKVRRPAGQQAGAPNLQLQPSRQLYDPQGQPRDLAPHGFQGSAWLEIWPDVPYILWKIPGTVGALPHRSTAYSALDAQLGGGVRGGNVAAIVGREGCGKRVLGLGMAIPWWLQGPTTPVKGNEVSLLILFRDEYLSLQAEYQSKNWQKVYALRIQPGSIRPQEFLGLVGRAIEHIQDPGPGPARRSPRPSLTRIFIDDISQIESMFPLCASSMDFLPGLLRICAQSGAGVTVICSEARQPDALSFSLSSQVQYVIRNSRQAAVGPNPGAIEVDVVSAPGAPTNRQALHLTMNQTGVPHLV